MSKTRLSLFVSVVLCAVTAQAIVYIVPSDRELVNSSKAIVIGTAIASHPELRDNGSIVTVAEFRVEQVLKGSVDDSTIEIVELGGFLSDRASVFPGSPRYEDGAQYLVLLEQWPDGAWRTSGWQLGQFAITTDLRGQRYLSRGGDEMIFGLDARDGSPYVDRFRSAAGFQTFIRTLASDATAPAREDYFVSRSDVMLARALDAQRKLVIAPNFTRADYLLSGNFRWQSGPSVAWGYCCPGNYPTTFSGPSAASAAVPAWNGNGTSINYSMTGETPGKTGGLTTADGANTVLFNDPNNIIGSSGAFAVGGISAAVGNYTLPDGITYANTQEVDVVVTQNSKIPAFINQALANSLMTHEVGHTLGFRHADGTASPTSPPPACAAPSPCAAIGAAIMAHVINCVGSPCQPFGLQQWDHDAQQTVYGSGPVCVPPSISAQPQSQTINSGTAATLTVAAAGTGPFTYQWFQGPAGNTSTPVGTNSPNFTTPPLTTTTQYWVQVTGQCAPVASSATATISIACTPVITTQPLDQTITSGGTATLTVAFTSATNTTVTWFRGVIGDTSTPIGTGASVTTPALTSSSFFWGQLTNGCGSTNTRNVLINVTSGCVGPQGAIASADSTTINAGQPVTLQVAVNGSSPLQYQWFRGTAPDPSNPIQGATNFTFTETPSGPTASYWVRITNACGNTASNTVVITVNGPPCTAPAITKQPQPVTIAGGTKATLSVTATGSNLHYAWFEGTAGDTTKPFGSDASTVTTRTLTANQSFWVQVSSDCGNVQSATVLVTVVPGRHRSVKH